MICTLPVVNDDVYRLRDAVLKAWHRRLFEAEVSIGILFASAPGSQVALMKGGHPVPAMIKTLSPRWRAVTTYDALLLIDRRFWRDLAESIRLVLLDQECSHLQVLLEEDGTGPLRPQRDLLGRPKLVYLPGDWNGGESFREVLARHREQAIALNHSWLEFVQQAGSPRLREAS